MLTCIPSLTFNYIIRMPKLICQFTQNGFTNIILGPGTPTLEGVGKVMEWLHFQDHLE